VTGNAVGVSEHHGTRPSDDDPGLLSELLRAVPRFVDRTRTQAGIAASLAVHLPCIGGLLGQGRPTEVTDPIEPGMHESVGIDVLSLLGDEPTDDGSAGPSPHGRVSAPPESALPIRDYDSLAASQVVPRLATLTEAELGAVRAYESAHRRRQTILNRISQRLGD
jgi:hypothetical protein